MAACLAITGFELFRAVWYFSDTHFVIVHSNLIPIFTIVARTVVLLVFTIRDYIYADIIVILYLANHAFLLAITAGITVHLTVVDFRTALVIGDFHVGIFAVEAGARALLVYAVVNGWDTHVRVLCKVVPVEAFQTLAVTVVVVAVGDCINTGAVFG